MTTQAELDPVDVALVEALQEDGRLTLKELGARVALSSSATHVRLRRLLDLGVVTGFRAEVDPASVGVGLQAIIHVQLDQHSRATLEAFGAHVASIPEVVSSTHVTGAFDFLLHVAVRDTQHLLDTAMAFTSREEVARLETAVVFEHVARTGWPVYT